MTTALFTRDQHPGDYWPHRDDDNHYTPNWLVLALCVLLAALVVYLLATAVTEALL